VPTLTDVTVDLQAALIDDELRHTAGRTAKETAHDVAAARLGSDRSFSGFRRKIVAKAGYDLTATGVALNLRPEGIWNLADKGVRRSGVILPKKGRRRRRAGHRPAVRTPRGFRYVSRYRAGQWRGWNILDELEERLNVDVAEAIDDHLIERFKAAG